MTHKLLHLQASQINHFSGKREEEGFRNSLKRTSFTWSGVKVGGGDAGRPSASIHSNTFPLAIGADGHQVLSFESAEAIESLIRVEEDRCMDPDVAPLEADAEPTPLEVLSLKIFFENFFFFDASKPNIILRPDQKSTVCLNPQQEEKTNRLVASVVERVACNSVLLFVS